MARVTISEARLILARCKIPLGADYHVLSYGTKDDLVIEARTYGYRKPKNANGSTGRYFHDYLQRLVAKGRG
jgi:hypothetical protein